MEGDFSGYWEIWMRSTEGMDTDDIIRLFPGLEGPYVKLCDGEVEGYADAVCDIIDSSGDLSEEAAFISYRLALQWASRRECVRGLALIVSKIFGSAIADRMLCRAMMDLSKHVFDPCGPEELAEACAVCIDLCGECLSLLGTGRDVPELFAVLAQSLKDIIWRCSPVDEEMPAAMEAASIRMLFSSMLSDSISPTGSQVLDVNTGGLFDFLPTRWMDGTADILRDRCRAITGQCAAIGFSDMSDVYIDLAGYPSVEDCRGFGCLLLLLITGFLNTLFECNYYFSKYFERMRLSGVARWGTETSGLPCLTESRVRSRENVYEC